MILHQPETQPVWHSHILLRPGHAMQLVFADELTPGAGAARAMLGWELLDGPSLSQPAEKTLGQAEKHRE